MAREENQHGQPRRLPFSAVESPSAPRAGSSLAGCPAGSQSPDRTRCLYRDDLLGPLHGGPPRRPRHGRLGRRLLWMHLGPRCRMTRLPATRVPRHVPHSAQDIALPTSHDGPPAHQPHTPPTATPPLQRLSHMRTAPRHAVCNHALLPARVGGKDVGGAGVRSLLLLLHRPRRLRLDDPRRAQLLCGERRVPAAANSRRTERPGAVAAADHAARPHPAPTARAPDRQASDDAAVEEQLGGGRRGGAWR